MIAQWQYALVKRTAVYDAPVNDDGEVIPQQVEWRIFYTITGPAGRYDEEPEAYRTGQTPDQTAEFVNFLNARGREGWRDLPSDPDATERLKGRKPTIWRRTATSVFWLGQKISAPGG